MAEKARAENLYESIKAAGIETDSWQSDLYFPVTAESTAILKQYPLQHSNATTFSSEGRAWYDVPFAYDPFWHKGVRQHD